LGGDRTNCPVGHSPNSYPDMVAVLSFRVSALGCAVRYYPQTSVGKRYKAVPLMVDKVAILDSARQIIQLAEEIKDEELRRDLVVEAAAIITLIRLSPDAPRLSSQ